MSQLYTQMLQNAKFQSQNQPANKQVIAHPKAQPLSGASPLKPNFHKADIVNKMIELQAETQSQIDVLIQRLSNASETLQKTETPMQLENVDD